MTVKNVNKNNFDEVLKSEKVVLLDFYADWCMPCKMIAPFVKEIAEENPQYFVGKVNVTDETELAREFGVSSIPMLVAMKDGEVVDRIVGAYPKASILKMLENC